MAQLVAMLEEAGLLGVYEEPDGQVIYRLTEQRVRLGHVLAMGDEADADLVLEALLGGRDPG